MGRKILGLEPKNFLKTFAAAYMTWFIIIELILVAGNLLLGQSIDGTLAASSILSLIIVALNGIIFKLRGNNNE